MFNGLRNYNLENGSRLGTYLRLKIDGAILDGIRGTTNADRKFLAYPNATLGELVRLSGYSTKSEVKRGNAYRKREEAILKRDGERDKIPYSTIETLPTMISMAAVSRLKLFYAATSTTLREAFPYPP